VYETYSKNKYGTNLLLRSTGLLWKRCVELLLQQSAGAAQVVCSCVAEKDKYEYVQLIEVSSLATGKDNNE